MKSHRDGIDQERQGFDAGDGNTPIQKFEENMLAFAKRGHRACISDPDEEISRDFFRPSHAVIENISRNKLQKHDAC